jgi:hypothetical protein
MIRAERCKQLHITMQVKLLPLRRVESLINTLQSQMHPLIAPCKELAPEVKIFQGCTVEELTKLSHATYVEPSIALVLSSID